MQQSTRGRADRAGVDSTRRVIQVHAVDVAGRVNFARALPREKSLHDSRRSVPKLEPQVLDALSVRRQVFPLVQTIEVVDAHLSDRVGLGHAQIHGDSPAPLRVGLQ